MKPSRIKDVLNIAENARQLGLTFNPCFVSPPGIGKSEIVEAELKRRGYKVIDIRTATLEAPDVLGFPDVKTDSNGRQRTVRALPAFWPTKEDGKVAIFIDEFNRGTTAMNNCFMQLLTKRQVGDDYTLPEDTLVVLAINPEDGDYDVTAMDPALKDRVEFFHIEYSKEDFLSHIKTQDWDPTIVDYVQSKWNYLTPENVGTTPGNKYTSPRTFSKLNAVRKSTDFKKVPDGQVFEQQVYQQILGANLGKDYYNYVHDYRPVTFEDIVMDKKKAFATLSKYCDPKNYMQGQVSSTIRSLLENEQKLNDKMLNEVLHVLPAEQGTFLVGELEARRKDQSILDRLFDQDSSLKQKVRKALAKKQEGV